MEDVDDEAAEDAPEELLLAGRANDSRTAMAWVLN